MALRGVGVSAGGQESIGSFFSLSLAPKRSLFKIKIISTSPQPSKALLAHQATTFRAESDSTLKHQLKNARVSAWKNGRDLSQFIFFLRLH